MEYSYSDLLPIFKAITFAKTSKEGEQIEADFLKGKDDEFLEYFQASKHSFQNDFVARFLSLRDDFFKLLSNNRNC